MRLNETAQDWMPHVRRLRPDLAWEDVVRIVNGPLPRERQWTQSRLLRAVNAYVRDGFLPPTVLDRAGRRETDDRLLAIVAAIKGADPGITLQAICTRLEAMRERTPRGRTSWQPSSVKMLLERAVRLWPVPGSDTVCSRKGVDDAKLAFHQQPILHVFAPQRGAPRSQSAGHDHRVVDREAVAFRQGASDVVGLTGQAFYGTQSAYAFQKRPCLLPTEAGFAAAVNQRLVQDLNANPGPLPQDHLGAVSLRAVVEQVKDDVRVRELSAHARGRG
jgi:hypothetical protein